MSFRPDFKNIKQEMPPPGGFPKVDFFERIGSRGPSSKMIWGVAMAASVYGYYLVNVGTNKLMKERHLEREAKMTMMPFLQAEADMAYLERKKEFLKLEAEVMKDVPGWVVGESVYKTDRWVPEAPLPLNKWYKK